MVATEQLRDQALIQAAKYHQGLRRYHDRNVRTRKFQVGDLVLRKIQSNKNKHKISPVWEGPFVVKSVSRPGAYRLMTLEEEEIPNSWNIEQLRRFYT